MNKLCSTFSNECFVAEFWVNFVIFWKSEFHTRKPTLRMFLEKAEQFCKILQIAMIILQKKKLVFSVGGHGGDLQGEEDGHSSTVRRYSRYHLQGTEGDTVDTTYKVQREIQ